MLDDFAIGINLGWYGNNERDDDIFTKYVEWLTVCKKHNISFVRIFLVRWCLDALFDTGKLNLLEKIIHEAKERNIKVCIVLNHFTDFIQWYYRDLSSSEFTWHTYPFNKKDMKSFFLEADDKYIKLIKKVVDKLITLDNVYRIELFNEIDLVEIDKRVVCKWLKKIITEVSTKKKRSITFSVSIAHLHNYNFYKKELSILVDCHIYSFPFSCAYKDIEYIISMSKDMSEICIGEYARFSDISHIKNVESQIFFCSGLWGAYFLGLRWSPFHWWWDDIINDTKYLQILDIFNQNIPYSFTVSDKSFYISDIVLEHSLFGKKSFSYILEKILFRLKNLIKSPRGIMSEYGAIKKFLLYILYKVKDKENIFIRCFEQKSCLFFYCEPRNNSVRRFDLSLDAKSSHNKAIVLDLLSGKKYCITLRKRLVIKGIRLDGPILIYFEEYERR